MLKQIAFCTLFAAKLLALSVSAPVTLINLEPKHVPLNIQVVMNERGDGVITWANVTRSGEGALESVIKPKEGSWLPPTLISKENIGAGSFQTVIDAEGNAGVLWRQSYNSPQLFLAEKKWMEPWSRAEEIFFNYQGFNFEKVVMDRDRNLLALGVKDYTAAALAFRDVKTHDIMYNERRQADITWSPEVFVDSRGVALAVWHSIYTQSGWFSHTQERVFEGAWHEDHQPWSMSEKIFTVPEGESTGGIKMAIDGERNAIVLKVIGTGENTKLQAFSREKEKWLAPVEVARVGSYMADLNFNMDETGNVLVIWRDMKNGDVYSAFKPCAQDWLPPMVVLKEGSFLLPVLIFDHAGNFVLVWMEKEEKLAQIRGAVFSTKDKMWSQPTRMSPEGVFCGFPSIAFSESGKGILAWVKATDLDKPDFAVQAAEISMK